MLYLQIAIPIEAIVKISPIAEPYALLARLYTSQKGEPKGQHAIRIPFFQYFSDDWQRIFPTIGEIFFRQLPACFPDDSHNSPENWVPKFLTDLNN